LVVRIGEEGEIGITVVQKLRSAMFIVRPAPANLSQAPERHEFDQKRRRTAGYALQYDPLTCRSGAWETTFTIRAINMALLTELARGQGAGVFVGPAAAGRHGVFVEVQPNHAAAFGFEQEGAEKTGIVIPLSVFSVCSCSES
jgi:hypothetical protein